MSKIEVIKCTENDIRIDKFLASALNKSRTEIQNLFKEGLVTVNDKIIKPSFILSEGLEIKAIVNDPTPAKIEKKDFDLDVVFEDHDVIVVNKPSGMVVHPAHGHLNDTLVNALMYHCDDLSSINGEIRPGIVHRIDKDTSGLLVACKNDFSHNDIAAQLKAKTTTRKYLAICYGTFDHVYGVVDAPIGRDPLNRKKMAVVENGKTAITHFKVLEKLGEYSFIECQLETGRTHQIRVHMAYIGHPVLGDPIYGIKKKVDVDFGQYLHAYTLGFVHPRTKEVLEFKVEPPIEFTNKLEELRNLCK